MLDEQLIHEVQNHAVIYNRQKYFINSSDPKKYLSKEDAWQEIAIKLNSDIETCKKRWKYLRERYVQQRKQGDPPNYEHLSRPYLDKMKFLDKHIQPRKSYKQVTSFLSSPNGSFPEYMDSSRSNGSLGNTGYHNNYLDSTFIKEEPQGSFQNFTTDLSPSSHQSIQNSQQQNVKAHHHHQQQSTREFFSTAAAVVAAAAAASSQTTTTTSSSSTTNNNNPSKRHSNHNNNNNSNNINNNVNGNNFRNGEVCHIPCPPSSSSSLKSIKSPLSSPRINIDHNNVDVDLKRPRIDIRSSSTTTTMNNNHHNNNNDDSSDNNADDGDGDDDDDDDIHTKRNNLIPNLANNIHNLNGRLLHNSNHHNDLFSLFQQQFTHHQHATTAAAAALNHPIKCSEQLLGELVTSELLKMTKERQKIVQRKILEILFFDD